jgi:hypothetical protein
MDNLLTSFDIRDAAVVALTVFWTLSVFVVKSRPKRVRTTDSPDLPVLSR